MRDIDFLILTNQPEGTKKHARFRNRKYVTNYRKLHFADSRLLRFWPEILAKCLDRHSMLSLRTRFDNNVQESKMSVRTERGCVGAHQVFRYGLLGSLG